MDDQAAVDLTTSNSVLDIDLEDDNEELLGLLEDPTGIGVNGENENPPTDNTPAIDIEIEPLVLAEGQQVFDFDDISDTSTHELFGGQQIGDFFWSEWWGVIHRDNLPGSGYDNGTVSPLYTGFNWSALPVSITSEEDFTFNSAYLTSAWEDGMNIEVIGLNDGVQLYSETVTVSTSGPTLFDFNFINVDEIQFSSSPQFVIDDFVYTPASQETGSISGYKWNDLDGNSVWDDGEPGLEGVTIYIDENENGELDDGEISTVTDAEGYYEFADLEAGTYVISEVIEAGWKQTYPDSIEPEAEAETSERSQSSVNSSETNTERDSLSDDTNTTAVVSESDTNTEEKKQDSEIPIEAAFESGEVIVKFSEDADVSSLNNFKASVGATTINTTKTAALGGIELLEIEGNVEDFISRNQDNEIIEYIEPNYTITVDATVPNDPSFDELWGLHNTGQTGGTSDADIDAPEAWDIQTGSNNVVVGVIDTGIDYTHPDLADNMWTNPGEIPDNGIDDDDNGYIDDVYGYDFAYGDSDPLDVQSHGTHVAGTIAANGDDGQGIVGVNWNADLMAIKFLNDSGSGSTFDAILAVEYATMMGADLTNNSWGGGGFSQGLYDAIAAAGAADSLFIASAGNSNNNNDVSPSYPGSYDLDNIIAVASTDHNDNRSSFSNYGATSVDLGAPGSSIYSTIPGGSYGYKSGTSMAAPHVAGVAALVLAENPDLSYEEVKEIILETTDPISALDGITLTGGRLNAFNALSEVGVPGTHTVQLDAGENVTDINFGNQEILPGSISGYNWNDLDGDGIWDDDEEGLAGWTIYIDDNENGELDDGEISTVTDADGSYSFGDLDPGNYVIAEVIEDGWEQTYPVAPGEYQWMETEFNWVDISGVGTPLGFSDDDYEEVSLPFDFSFYGEEKSTVKISSNGYLTFGSDGTDFSNDSIPNSNEPNDLIAPFWDDLYPPNGGEVYYHYDENEEQFIVQYQNIPHINGTGDYSFEVILEPDGSIIYQYETLNGIVDSSTIGIENADGSEGLQISYNDGYAEEGLAIKIDLGSEALPHIVSVGNGEAVTDIDFGNQEMLPGSISGYNWNDLDSDGIWDENEEGLEGWTIYIDDNENGELDEGEISTVTDAEGYYEFDNLDAGTYVIAEELQDGWEQTYPGSGNAHTVELEEGEDVEEINFGNWEVQLGSISGYKWNDLDGNSEWDDGEPILEGVTIYIDENENGELDEGENSTVTDAEGYYEFADLEVGTYVIGEVIPEGWKQTYPDSIVPEAEAEAETSERSQSSTASEERDQESREIPIEAAFESGEVIVKFSEDADVSSLNNFKASVGATTINTTKTEELSGLELLEIEGNVDDFITRNRDNPLLEYIEPNYTITVDSTVPNDPSFDQLWGLNNTGQTGGTSDADIDAPEAWDIQTGSNNVVVGVIDTGIDYTHPDLADNMWTNPGEIPDNGIDDDGNGYVDDVYGYDFAYGDSDPFDGDSHGTHVAGTIGANGDDGQGVVGVNWDADLMALKFLDDSGSGSLFNAILAVEYATMMGADLTNNSWGGGGFSQGLYDAIAAAEAADSLFVAAAGNSNNNNDISPSYPGSYDLDNIISVASTDHNDNRSSFSNYGATSVDLGAPGSDIYSTVPGGGYASYSGTSMASPHVAGVAALVLAENPDLSYAEVKEIILETTDPISALDGITLTGGRLNAFNALSEVGVPGSHTVQLDAGENVTDINFGNQEILPGSISGYNWNDLDGDGIWDDDEEGLEGWTIYIDDNENGELDDGELSTLTDVNGFYIFEDLAPETSYIVAEAIEDGWEQTYPGATSQVIFEADFSDDQGNPDLDGFTVDNTGASNEGLWHLSTRRGEEEGHSGVDSMYYGIEETGDYDAGDTAGRIISPVIDLSGLDSAQLSFNYFLEVESSNSYDQATVLISENGGAFVPIASKAVELENPTTGWTNATFDLSSYVGEEIEISFDFDTVDGIINQYEGWLIDDVVVETGDSDPFHIVEVGNGENVEDIDFGNLYLEAEPEPLTIIENHGTAAFAQDTQDNTYWIVNNDTQAEMQLQNSQGVTYTDDNNPNWDGAAVETDGEGGYRFLLDGANNREDEAYVWFTDDQGVITGNSGWVSGDDLLPLESEFNVDLDDDGIIGIPPEPLTIIENDGTAAFAKDTQDNTYWIVNNDTQAEVQLQNSQGVTYTDDNNPNWDGAAVETDGEGGYRFLLEGANNREGQAYVWFTDDQGVITGNSGWVSGDDLLPLESEFNVDLDGNDIIGVPPEPLTIIENDGTAAFAQDTQDNTYWIVNNDTQAEVQLQNSQGVTYTDDNNPNWDGAAVETDGEGGYRFLLDGANNREDEAYVWFTDDQGVITGNSGWVSGDDLLPLESEFNVDLDGNDIIGVPPEPLTIIENDGTAAFAKDTQDNTYWIVNNDTQAEVQLQNSQGLTYTDDNNPNWDGAAVETDGEGGYRFLLDGANNREGQAYVWFTDEQGVITGNSGWVSGDDLLPLESEFNVDLDGNDIIGVPPEPLTIIENDGTAAFAKDTQDNTYWIVNNDTQAEVQLQNSQGVTYTDDNNPNWDGAAVETDGEGGYRFLLEGVNNREDEAFVWFTDDQGVITGNSGWVSGDDLLPLESEFNVDLNGNDIIGSSQGIEDELLAVDDIIPVSGDGILS